MKAARLLLLVCALLLVPSVFASSTIYTSASAFAAATQNSTLITFTAPSSTTFAVYSTDPGTGTTFAMNNGGINVTGKDYYGPGTYSSDFIVGTDAAYTMPSTLTITPPSGYSAFAFDIGGVFGAATFDVTLSDGSMFSINVPASFATSFFGFTSTSGITSVKLDTFGDTNNPETYAITDVTLASVPEPASLLVMGAGLAGLAAKLRRK